MKKFIAIILLIIIVLCAVYYIGTGFGKVGSIAITDFEVSEDGTEMMIKTSNFSSAGYIRKAKIHQQESGKLYIDFIAAFGGINGNIGAKDEFVIPLDSETKVIGIYRAENAYDVILEKDKNGEWAFAKE